MDNKKDKWKELNEIIDKYDTLLPFNRYLSMIIPEYTFDDNVSFKICCPLHEEKTPSFSYSHNLDLWTCFGQCHTSGKTVKFHHRWLRKQYGDGITIMQAINDLQRRFPHILPTVQELTGRRQDAFGNVTYGKQSRQDQTITLAQQLKSGLAGVKKAKPVTVVNNLTLDEELLKLFITNVKES